MSMHTYGWQMFVVHILLGSLVASTPNVILPVLVSRERIRTLPYWVAVVVILASYPIGMLLWTWLCFEVWP